jgi:hypothetical protein
MMDECCGFIKLEVAEHHEEGTTDAYEHDDFISGELFHGGKGKHK